MITSLQGILEARGANWLAVNIGGIGLKVLVPTSVLGAVGAQGEPVRLHTHLHVREDALTLYGFVTTEERDLFEDLIEVEGVGPKLALNMLSTMSAADLVAAILAGDQQRLGQVPGIGKKISSRLILELRGKLEKEWVVPETAVREPIDGEVVSALSALGYTPAEVRRALAALALSTDMPLDEKITRALQHLGRG